MRNIAGMLPFTIRISVHPHHVSLRIMRLVDTRFAGIARGVGTAKILGRVHSVQLKLADIHLPCAITIMEVCLSLISLTSHTHRHYLQGRDVDLLFGLDMLKAHQACIDLENNSLRIGGREVKFLSEHELPEKARQMDQGEGASDAPPSATRGPPQPTPFPGGGRSLGATPSSRTPGAGAGRPTTNVSEDSIRTLMDLGASRELAISTLEAAAGNVDVAASLLF